MTLSVGNAAEGGDGDALKVLYPRLVFVFKLYSKLLMDLSKKDVMLIYFEFLFTNEHVVLPRSYWIFKNLEHGRVAHFAILRNNIQTNRNFKNKITLYIRVLHK